jgi:heme/copper-type cytochrome/quinol oxidase subunit 4
MSNHFGSQGQWNFIFICAILGFIYGVYIIIRGIIWIMNHINITW